jgi:hypothetical protein
MELKDGRSDLLFCRHAEAVQQCDEDLTAPAHPCGAGRSHREGSGRAEVEGGGQRLRAFRRSRRTHLPTLVTWERGQLALQGNGVQFAVDLSDR